MLIAKAIHFYHCGRAVFQRVLPIPRVLLGLGLVCLLSFICLTYLFFSPHRIFRSKLENWKAKPASTVQASAPSPCMPFSWFNESRKGSYSFRNLPSAPNPLPPSPETQISDKTGSKVDYSGL